MASGSEELDRHVNDKHSTTPQTFPYHSSLVIIARSGVQLQAARGESTWMDVCPKQI